MVKALIHVCCAPCLTYPLRKLKEKGFDVSGFFYNPNIHPFAEYQRRRRSLEEFSRHLGVEVTYHPGYDVESYFRQISFKESTPERCQICHRLRLARTAKAAKEKGLEVFTTTLLVSPYQDHQMIREIGQQLAEEEDIKFYYEDFRNGYQEAVRLSKEANLYRQKYCGCIFSERDRFKKKDGHDGTQLNWEGTDSLRANLNYPWDTSNLRR